MATVTTYNWQFQINLLNGKLELMRVKTVTITTGGGGGLIGQPMGLLLALTYPA